MKLLSWIEVSDDETVITIEGVNYARDLFKALGTSCLGAKFEIRNREDGVVTLGTIPDPNDKLVKRMQIIVEWMEEAKSWEEGKVWKWFVREHPEAADWFDEDGVAR